MSKGQVKVEVQNIEPVYEEKNNSRPIMYSNRTTSGLLRTLKKSAPIRPI